MDKEYRLYVTYDEEASGGEPLSDERWCNYSDTYKTVTFLNLYKSPPKDRFFYDSIELSKKEWGALSNKEFLYLAVIRYQTGGTFATTHGAWHIVGLSATREGAEKLIKQALNGNGYKPWEGYFERFEDSETHKLMIEL